MESNFPTGNIYKFCTLFGLVLSLALPPFAYAEVYKWVDENGNIHFSDQKPPGTDTQHSKVELKKDIPSPRLPIDQPIPVNSTFSLTSTEKPPIPGIPFPYTEYSFQDPLLEKSRVYGITTMHGKIWLATKAGLINFAPGAEHWTLINKSQGLPGEYATELLFHNRQLFMRILSYNEIGGYYLPSMYMYEESTGSWANYEGLTFATIKAGQHFRKTNSDIAADFYSDALQLNGKVWLASPNRTKSRKSSVSDFIRGGVSILDPITGKGVVYDEDSGLADSDCAELAYDEFNQRVWVSHPQSNNGLSYFELTNQNAIKTIRESINGIQLNGRKLQTLGNILVIEKARKIIVFDTISERAQIIDLQELPYSYITDIHLNGNELWFSLSDGGQAIKTGPRLYKFDLRLIKKSFEKYQNQEPSI